MSQREILHNPLLLSLFVCATLWGCGKSDESKTKSNPDPTSVDPSVKTTTDTTPSPPPPDLATIEVGFLVDPCVESGLPAEACQCAGEDAKTRIGHVLLSKMSKAPADSDPAIQSYYTVAEMQKIMHWVEAGGVKCGIEEAE